MSRFVVPPRPEPRLQAAAQIESLRGFFRRLKHSLAVELAKEEPDQARCYSLQQAIIELTTFFPSLKEEDQ